MERVLVVIEPTEANRELLVEAGELAAASGAELVLLTILTPEEFENDVQVMGEIATVEQTSYTEKEVLENVANVAAKRAREVLSDENVEFEVVGDVADEGEQADSIIEVATNRDCDYVFLNGRERTPAGKAIFGDTTQAVILNFDGYVTVSTE